MVQKCLDGMSTVQFITKIRLTRATWCRQCRFGTRSLMQAMRVQNTQVTSHYFRMSWWVKFHLATLNRILKSIAYPRIWITSCLYRFSTEIQYSYFSSGASGVVGRSCRESDWIQNRIINVNLPMQSLRFLEFAVSGASHLFKASVDLDCFLFDKNLRSEIVHGDFSDPLERSFWRIFALIRPKLENYLRRTELTKFLHHSGHNTPWPYNDESNVNNR